MNFWSTFTLWSQDECCSQAQHVSILNHQAREGKVWGLYLRTVFFKDLMRKTLHLKKESVKIHSFFFPLRLTHLVRTRSPRSGECGWGSDVRNKEGSTFCRLLKWVLPHHFISLDKPSVLSTAYTEKGAQTWSELLRSYLKKNTPMYPPSRSRNRTLPAPRVHLPLLPTTAFFFQKITILTGNTIDEFC